MWRSRRPSPGRFIRPGRFALSFDIAQSLAPAGAGPIPGLATSPDGDAGAVGDFAAVLGNLGGPVAGAAASPSPGVSAGPAAGSAIAIQAPDVQAPVARVQAVAAVPPGVIPGASLPQAAGATVSILPAARAAPPQVELNAPPGEDDARPEDVDPASAIALASPDGAALALAAAPALIAAQIPVATPMQGHEGGRTAAPAPETGAEDLRIPTAPGPEAQASRRGRTPAQPPAAGPATRIASAPGAGPDLEPLPATDSGDLTPPPPRLGTDPAGDAPLPASRPPEVQGRTPPPAALAFALAAGVVKVTGQVVAAAADAPGKPEPDAAQDPAEGIALPATAGPQADPFQAPEAIRQGQLLSGTPADARPAEPRRPAAATAASGKVLSARSADPEGVRLPTPEADPFAPASPARPAEVAGGPARTLSSDARAEADEADDVLAKLKGADPQATPAPTASTPAQTETPEAPPAPARATSETVAALSAQMARRLDDGTTRFDLELTPGDLGRVDVRLEIDASGGIRAAFTFEHAHSASELGRRADELQKSLESAGFNLSGGLSFDVAGDRPQGRSPSWAEARDDRTRTPNAPEPDLAREGPAPIADALNGRRSPARSGVDIRI